MRMSNWCIYFIFFIFGSMIPFVFFPPIVYLYAAASHESKAVISMEVSGLANYHTSTTAQNHQHNHQTQCITDGERAKETPVFVGHHTFFIINAVFKHVFCLEHFPVVLLCEASIVPFLDKRSLFFL